MLDAHVLSSREDRAVANEATGHRELVEWLKASGGGTVVLEASGGYEQAVVKVLRRAGLTVRVVDSTRVRHYAKALGRLAKNDRIDARMEMHRNGLAQDIPAAPHRHRRAG